MLKRLSRDERGFTLIELLVVILVLGILAAIAIPAFTGKREQATDAEAKSNARNLMTHVDSCFVPAEDFRLCSTQAQIGAHELDWGPGPGQVRVTATTRNGYELAAVSRDGSTYSIRRTTSGDFVRECDGGAGCRDGGW